MGVAASLVSNASSAPVTLSLITGCVWMWSHIYLGALDQGQVMMNLHHAIKYNQWYRVISSPFVHVSPWHLMINVMALWGCCSRVEIVFGSLFFLKYTVMLMFAEVFGTIGLIQLMVIIYRKRNRLYHEGAVCTRRLSQMPTSLARSGRAVRDQIEYVVHRVLNGGSVARQQIPDHRYGRASSVTINHEDNGDDGDEEAGMRETDRLTGGSSVGNSGSGSGNGSNTSTDEGGNQGWIAWLRTLMSPSNASSGTPGRSSDAPATAATARSQEQDDTDAFEEEEWDPEYDDTRRSSFAALTTHPMTSEPVMGFSSIILAWLAFIAMQWYLRYQPVPAGDSTTMWLHKDHSAVGISTVGSAPATSGGTDGSNSTSTSTGTGIDTDTDPSSSSSPSLFDRENMSSVPFVCLGIIPILVPIAPLFFMFASRLSLHPQIQTLTSHIRYALANAIMYSTGVLLAYGIVSLLNTWFWLLCFAFNVSLLLLGSLLTNRKLFRGSGYGAVGWFVDHLSKWERTRGAVTISTRASATTHTEEEDEEDEEVGLLRQQGGSGGTSSIDMDSNNAEEEEEDEDEDDLQSGRGLSYALLHEGSLDPGCEGRVMTVYTARHMVFSSSPSPRPAPDAFLEGGGARDDSGDDGDGSDGILLGGLSAHAHQNGHHNGNGNGNVPRRRTGSGSG